MSGITPAPQEGAANVFIIPKLLISPIKGPPVLENERVKPQKVHWKDMTEITLKPWKIMASADFLLAIPP